MASTKTAPKTAVPERYTFDASTQVLGRLATQISQVLMGKHRMDYARHTVAPVKVVVTNSDNVLLTGNKYAAKTYYRYSGYPGGMRERSLSDQIRRDSTVVVKRAVSGMLPKNNLRDVLMKNLTVYTGAEPTAEPATKTSKS